MSEHSDAALLAGYLAGDEGAFRVLVERYAPLIYALARREGPAGLAEDVTQAVFLLLAQRAKYLRHPHLLAAWLLKVAHYCAAEARRSAARRQRHERKAAGMARTVITDPPPAEPDALEAHLHAALQSLGAADRTAIVLRYFRERPLAEIAAALSISEEAAKKRVARAVGKLRKVLVRKHVPVSAALLSAAFAQSASAAPPALAAKIAIAALAKSATPAAALLIAKGATKLMAYTTAKLTAAATLAVLVVAAGTTALVHQHKSTHFIAVPAPAAPALPITATIISTPSVRILPNDPLPTIEVRDLTTNAPLTGVTIQIQTASHNGPPMIQAPPTTAETSADGSAHLPYPPTTDNVVIISASKPGYVPVGTFWRRIFPTDRAPDHFDLTLEKAITVGGRVLDLQGNPLAHATVLLNINKAYPSGAKIDAPMFATTNAQGEWTLDTVPEICTFISIGAAHPLCLDNSGFISTQPAIFPSPTFDPALFAQLRNRTQVLRLERGAPLSVTVHAPNGTPLKAALTVGFSPDGLNAIPDFSTDDHGHIQLGIRKNTAFIIAAHAPGFASAVAAIAPNESPSELQITLTPAKPLTARIVDTAGKPIANATVCADHWEEKASHMYARDFRVTLVSDNNGNVTWTEAPPGDFTFAIAAPGCMEKEATLTPGKLNLVTLFPQPLIRVHAISARTGKPVADYHPIEGGCYDIAGRDVQWLDYPEFLHQMKTLPNNTYEFTDDQQRAAIRVRVTGDHYLPTDSAVLPLDGHDYDVTLPLEEAERLTGQLFDGEGSPLANATLRLHTGWTDIYNAQLAYSADQIASDPVHFSTTDQDGNFSFPPQAGNYLLTFGGNQGYVLANQKEFEAAGTLTLKAWASIHGVLRSGSAPARAGIRIIAEGIMSDDMNVGPGVHYEGLTDGDGRFTFTHVFAGEYVIEVDPDYTQKAKVERKVKIRPGQTAAVTLNISDGIAP